jgi:hypothetical protein
MLRIRPTSIGLSERDIDLHFHQINLYRTLRRNGYSKQQIQHFYDTQQQIKRDEENEAEVQDSSAQSSSNAIKADNASESSSSYFEYALIVIYFSIVPSVISTTCPTYAIHSSTQFPSSIRTEC